MSEDMRERYARLLTTAPFPGKRAYDKTDALLAERDEEMERLRAELAATIRAKQENDERFMLQAAEQKERADKAEAAVERARSLALQWISKMPEDLTESAVRVILAEAGSQVIAALDTPSAPESPGGES